MKIPCDTIARLAHLLPSPDEERIDAAFASFRLDNGKVIVSNRMFLAVELVQPFDGVFYIAADEKLITQCRTEAQYNGVIDFTPVPALRYTTAITTLGARFTENIGVWLDEPSELDRWHDVAVKPCLEPLEASAGPMVFEVEFLARLAQASPSGRIVLEQNADPERRPTIARDIDSGDWVGFFRPRINDGRHHQSATVPEWCR